MFNLPQKTALLQPIAKKHIYEAFSDDFTAEKKKLFNQNMIFSLKFKDNFVPAVYMKNGTFLQGA